MTRLYLPSLEHLHHVIKNEFGFTFTPAPSFVSNKLGIASVHFDIELSGDWRILGVLGKCLAAISQHFHEFDFQRAVV